MKKKLLIAGLCTLMLGLFLNSPLAPYVESLAIMSVYSHINDKESLPAEKNVEVKIPSGDGWYPFVMTYNANEEFADFAGDNGLRLTILYNFPKFDLTKGCSKIYDAASPYYSSFYGAYVINGKYGLGQYEEVDTAQIAKVAEFDFKKLVLEDLGMEPADGVFQWDVKSIEKTESYAGWDDWICINAEVLVNGMWHQPKEALANYIQYGRPNYDGNDKAEFAPVEMKGRIYGKHFEEWDVSIFFYVMAPLWNVVKECDEEILQKSVIEVAS